MIGSFLNRALVLVLGYAYPAYECFKTVELNRPDIEQLRFWCQYWILVAALTVFERVGDTFISWMPMYSEAKVIFFVYLWYPKTRGTMYIYETFFKPYVASRETEIDRNLLELKTRAGDMVFLYCQKAAIYGQSQVFEIFQYMSFRAPQQQARHRSTLQRQPVESNNQIPASAAAQKPPQSLHAPPSPTKSRSQGPAKSSEDPVPVPMPQAQPSLGCRAPASPSASGNTSQPSISRGEVKQITAAPVAATAAVVSTEDSKLSAPETPMEEAIRMTRGRLRKRAASFGPSIH